MSKPYVTQRQIEGALRAVGIAGGETLLVHASMSALGHVIGGAGAIVAALLEVLGDAGTLVVATHTPENSDPAEFRHPPLPEHAQKLWVEHYPAFDRRLSVAATGAVAELVRQLPGALRSDHPLYSFAAVGPQAGAIIEGQLLEDGMGEHSPLARIYELHGKIALIGVGHEASSSMHLAEARAGTARRIAKHAAVVRDGARQWLRYEDYDFDNAAFCEMGEALERAYPPPSASLGASRVRAYDQRQTVDFAEAWLRARQGEGV